MKLIMSEEKESGMMGDILNIEIPQRQLWEEQMKMRFFCRPAGGIQRRVRLCTDCLQK